LPDRPELVRIALIACDDDPIGFVAVADDLQPRTAAEHLVRSIPFEVEDLDRLTVDLGYATPEACERANGRRQTVPAGHQTSSTPEDTETAARILAEARALLRKAAV
jgi:hypothetical protein